MQLRVLDLFSGCGGLSLGLSQAGCKVIAALEIDQWAADTYEANHRGVDLLKRDIRDIPTHFWNRHFRNDIDLVAGGPPCQGFSVSGKRQYGISSEQNSLVLEFIRAVEAVAPKFVLMENVGGFKTANIGPSTPALQTVQQALNSLGYHVAPISLQAFEYGVPQYRSRVFVLGCKIALNFRPFLTPTHSLQAKGRLLPAVSVLEAIADLPEIDAGGGCDDLQPYTTACHNEYQRRMREDAIGVFNHQAMRHSKRLIARFAGIPPGGKSYELGRRPMDDERPVTVYKSNNQRLVADLPSLCITANFQSNYIHPLLHRNLTAREGARIMTFPDTYIFKGKRTLMSSTLLRSEGRHAENHLSQYNQIGNAVPPLLARLVGEGLMRACAHPEAIEFSLPRSQEQMPLF